MCGITPGGKKEKKHQSSSVILYSFALLTANFMFSLFKGALSVQNYHCSTTPVLKPHSCPNDFLHCQAYWKTIFCKFRKNEKTLPQDTKVPNFVPTLVKVREFTYQFPTGFDSDVSCIGKEMSIKVVFNIYLLI